MRHTQEPALFVARVAAAFQLGFVVEAAPRDAVGADTKFLIVTGFRGALSTSSAFSYERQY